MPLDGAVQTQPALLDAPERAELGRREGRERGGIGLADAAGGVQLAGEGDEHPEIAGVLRGGDQGRVEQVGGAVGARCGRGAHRAGEDDRRLAGVDEIAQERHLLERVGPVGDDDAAAGGGLLTGRAGDVERLGGGQRGARAVEQRAHGQALDPRQPGDGRDERRAVERGGDALCGGLTAAHRDGPARSEHGDGTCGRAGHAASL
jgi:hypothetical protein